MGLMTDSPTNPDSTTGTRRLDLWSESAEGGGHGDLARGTAYSARYLSDDEAGCAEVAIYPELAEDGSYEVVSSATIGRAVLEDGVWRPADDAEIEYEYLNTMTLTLEQAQSYADQRGQEDISHALYLRKRT